MTRAAVVFLALVACGHADPRVAAPAPAPTPRTPTPPLATPSPRASTSTSTPTPPAPTPQKVRYLAVGGGTGPDDNQVQIEADLTALMSALGPDGVLLYAGGPGTRAVQVEDAQAEAAHAHADPVLARLGELLDPRGARTARYRMTTLPVNDEATLPALGEWLHRTRTDPLTLAFVGHGGAGATTAENDVVVWGGDDLQPAELADLLDAERTRETRLLMTTCYSGAFADVLFTHADPTAGVASPLRCGFFATSATRVASGCDPDPDRQAVEGYLIHALPALAGKDRSGNPLPAADIDFDHDGIITMAEAHARARIASRGFDVPTSTSARWLEVQVPDPGEPVDGPAWPEEDAVIAALGAGLGLRDAAAAHARMNVLDAAREAAATASASAADDEDEAARAAIGELLARWPELGDPWHPDFQATYQAAHDELARWLETSKRYEAYRDANARAGELAERADDATLAEAPVERLAAAYDNVARARALDRQGGPALKTFEALRACERRPLRD